jgi:hypothetical protein
MDSGEVINRRTAMAGLHTSVYIYGKEGSIILSFILVNISASLYAVKGGTGLLFYFLNQSYEKGTNKHKYKKAASSHHPKSIEDVVSLVVDGEMMQNK